MDPPFFVSSSLKINTLTTYQAMIFRTGKLIYPIFLFAMRAHGDIIPNIRSPTNGKQGTVQLK
jgi:hypothetical protein